MHVARGDYEAAIASAEEAIAAAQAELEVLKGQAAKKGVPFTQDRLEQEETAVLLTAEVYEAMGDSARAHRAVHRVPVLPAHRSQHLRRRADVKAEAGDTAGAEADYREALAVCRR